MMLRASLLAFGLAVALAPSRLSADEPVAKADPRIELAGKIPGAKPEDLRASPIPGIYELTRGADIAYVSSDGKYAIVGDLYDINIERQPHGEHAARRAPEAARRRSRIADAGVLAAESQVHRHRVHRHRLHYCRKLHSQIAEYNRLGIRVRYLFYPRTGPDTESWAKAEQVWCSSDRNDAFTRMKRGESVSGPKQCKGSPVAQDYALGQKLDIGGTPAMLLEDGELLSGYLPPAMLAQHLRGE